MRVRSRTWGVAVGLWLWLVFAPSVGHAISLNVTLDTTPLGSGSFALDFQFVAGDSGLPNTVTLSSFGFGGGSADAESCAVATCVNGGSISGSPLAITLTDDPAAGGDFFNEVILPFTPGASGPLSFVLDVVPNVLAGSIPDAFSLAILSGGVEIPTTGPANQFLQIDLTAPLTIATYASADDAIGAPRVESAQAVPEPASLVLMGTGLIGVMLVSRRLGRRDPF